jgi:hypothetical protein
MPSTNSGLTNQALDDVAAGRLTSVRIEDLDELIPGSRAASTASNTAKSLIP